MDKNFDKTLKSRKMENHSANFMDNIIFASTKVEQKLKLSFGQLIEKIFAEFMMPKPAYAMAIMLIVGVMLGTNLQSNSTDGSEVAQNELFDDGGII